MFHIQIEIITANSQQLETQYIYLHTLKFFISIDGSIKNL